MLVCENHRDKRWPDECDCGPGMNPEDRFADARVYEHEGKTYAIRDVWSSGGHVYQKGDRLVRCEYAVKSNDSIVWKPCDEGVSFAEIAPYA